MKKKYVKLLFIGSLIITDKSEAQNSEIVQVKDTAYMNVVQKRAQKIVGTLNLSSDVNTTRVQNNIAWHYYNLNTIYKKRDSILSAIKKDTANAKQRKEQVVRAAEKSVDSLHPVFLSRLSQDLDSAQIGTVKDGLTYDVLHVTYGAYQEMIPNLTEAQKKQIYTWLVEAREHSMDAESSEKKHWWFGKYKGRINNYLSAQGYDLKKATDDWQKRVQAQKQ